jgi:16S rRNA (uracil1498-N3)-methyltransferase
MRPFPRCFVPDAATGKVVTLPEGEAHRLVHVLRLRPGDGVGLFDGLGGEWVGFVQALVPEVTIDVVEESAAAAEPPVRVTLAVGLLKGAQMDSVIRDATMLGVFAIAPMSTQHVSIGRRAWRGGEAVERWNRVALASARQCRRAVVPVISPVTAFDAVLTATRADVTLMCVEPGRIGDGVTTDAGPAPGTALVMVGPEGGWSPEEIARAEAAGARFIHLGPRTLRAETAPTVALSCLWTQWGW